MTRRRHALTDANTSIQIQPRDDGVVHLEQQLEPIALAGQCLLCRSDAFVVQDVVDGDGYLIRRPAA